LLSTTLASGCTSTKISDILDNFRKYEGYEGKEVTIEGSVGETIWFGLLEKGAFQVGESSGHIWVITSQPPSQEGSTVAVRGTVQAAVQLGERSFGRVIVETNRE
jgi:hypothetical protein